MSKDDWYVETAVDQRDDCSRALDARLQALMGRRQAEGQVFETVYRAPSTVIWKAEDGSGEIIHRLVDAVLARRWTPEATGYVFGRKNWNGYRSAWETALRAAKIESFRFHDLRHTFASWAVQRGASLQEVKDLLGHKSLAMTLRYAHLAPERLRAAVATLDGILSSATAQQWHMSDEPVSAPTGSSEERLQLR
jgi:integrase